MPDHVPRNLEGRLPVLKIDDLVVLVSGGPELKVIGLSPNGRVWVQWETAHGQLEEASFRPEMLRPAR
jgi:uncharacterized protein YodC (DUF2158 family)